MIPLSTPALGFKSFKWFGTSYLKQPVEQTRNPLALCTDLSTASSVQKRDKCYTIKSFTLRNTYNTSCITTFNLVDGGKNERFSVYFGIEKPFKRVCQFFFHRTQK